MRELSAIELRLQEESELARLKAENAGIKLHLAIFISAIEKQPLREIEDPLKAISEISRVYREAVAERDRLTAENAALVAQLREQTERAQVAEKEVARMNDVYGNPFKCFHAQRFIWRGAFGGMACAACRMLKAEEMEKELAALKSTE
jgi:hypothetical protein